MKPAQEIVYKGEGGTSVYGEPGMRPPARPQVVGAPVSGVRRVSTASVLRFTLSGVLAVGVIAAAASILLGSARAAHAACTDPARPGADWSRCYFEERDLSGVDLSGARLRDARFNRAQLSGSDLTGIDGHRAKFITSRLLGVRFDDARLTEVDFTKADLTGASFRGADMRRSRLFRAILRNVDLTDALMTGADLLKADLSGATWTDGSTVCAEGSIGQCN